LGHYALVRAQLPSRPVAKSIDLEITTPMFPSECVRIIDLSMSRPWAA
jgi:hypothetical protein